LPGWWDVVRRIPEQTTIHYTKISWAAPPQKVGRENERSKEAGGAHKSAA